MRPDQERPHAKDFRAFWTEAHRAAFATHVPAALKKMKLQAVDFDKHGTCHGYAIVYFAEADNIKSSMSTYHRARRRITPVSDDALTAMLYGLGTKLEDWLATDHGVDDGTLKPVHDLYKGLIAARQSPPRARQRDGGTSSSRSDDAVTSALSLLANAFHIKGHVGPDTVKRLFREEDGIRIHFETYRFSSDPGYVHKSFTVVKRPTDELPVCTFRNFMRHESGERHASGIILPFGQQTVFLGQSENGNFAKLMVLRSTSPQDAYHGLLISEEHDEDAIAARFLMKRSAFTHSREVNMGKVGIKDIDLEQAQKDGIRNRIKFVLEDEVHNAHGLLRTQEQIVRYIGQLMEDNEGFPMLTIGDPEAGVPFNPAADSFYTFNAALKRK